MDGDTAGKTLPPFLRKLRTLIAAAAFLSSVAAFPLLPLFSDDGGGEAAEDSLIIKLITVGPADELYSWWGHSALVVEDTESGLSYLYDYGQFTFDAENFVRNFAFGRLWFSVGRSPSRLALNFWASEIRDLRVQVLNLPPQNKRHIFNRVEFDNRPENRTYLYDHYDDNCATRLADIIDATVDGQFREKHSVESDYTLRELTRQYTYFHPFMELILMFLLGSRVDEPILEWDEMFLPLKLEKHAADFTYVNPDGERVPLVSETYTLTEAPHRPPVLENPPRPIPLFLSSGVVLAALALFFLRFQWRDRRILRIGYAAYTSLVCFVLGVIGTVLFFMALFTDHSVTYRNENLLFINPLLLAAIPVCIGAVRKKKISLKIQTALFTLLTFSCFVVIVLKMFGVLIQRNWGFLIMVMPMYIVLGPLSMWVQKRSGDQAFSVAGRKT
jgi:hypothetical protein